MFANRGAWLEMFDEQRPEVVIDVVEPGNPIGRMIGLIGWEELEPAKGMLLRTRQVHTMAMRFAIDAVYIASDGRVIRVKTLKPGRFGPIVLSARWVLELAAGECSRLGLDVGSKLVRRPHPSSDFAGDR